LYLRAKHRLYILSRLEEANAMAIDDNETAAYDEGLIDYIPYAI
jgi:hypothetical protein